MKFQITLSSKIHNLCGLALIFFFSVTSLAIGNSYAPYPEADTGYVTDIAGLLTKEEEEQIETWLWQVESKRGLEIAVVTIGSIKDYSGTDNSSIEQFAKGLFNAYGIGNMPKNDGILFLVAKNDRKARIELGAYYGHAYDDQSSRIMEGIIIPQFKSGHYNKGIINGTRSILSEFARVRTVTSKEYYGGGSALVLLLIIAASLFWSGKRSWAWLLFGLIFAAVGWLTTVLAKAAADMPSSSSDTWSPGGFGGGFGGGSSGGGGATGSW